MNPNSNVNNRELEMPRTFGFETKEADIEAVLELLGQLRRGYENLEMLVATEPERLLAQTARRAVDLDIQRMCELQRMAAAHRAHMADFAHRVQRSQIHVRLIELMLQQTRHRFESEMAATAASLPDAGGDDGGAARRMRQMQQSLGWALPFPNANPAQNPANGRQLE
ncbi:hypothetical protein KR018_011614 [Drosophila ironensis]|nr:hypothetical protein KR018_011614 [Drosophila ironensis]